jgi:hypothetical protein
MTTTTDDVVRNLEQKVQVLEEELYILRKAQTECVSMAEDIQKLYACIEEQRQHIAASAASNGTLTPDVNVGVFTMLDALSRKQQQVLNACNDTWRTRCAELEQENTACKAYFNTALQYFNAQLEDATYRYQFDLDELYRSNDELQHSVNVATQLNAQNERTIAHISHRNTHLQREVDVQFACIQEQRHHLQFITSKDGPVVADPNVGIVTLLKQIKLNEFRYYQEKLATDGGGSSSSVTSASSSSSWGKHMSDVAAVAVAVVAADANAGADTVTAATSSSLSSCHTPRSRKRTGVSPKATAALLRCLFRVRERKHQSSLNSQKQLAADALGRLRVARKEAEERNGFMERLKESNAELAEKVDRLMEMNSTALKSRDTLQMKLYTTILEKQKVETDHNETTGRLRAEEASHATTRAKLLAQDKKFEAVLAIVSGNARQNTK